MRIEFSIGIPDSIASSAKKVVRRRVLFPVVAAVVALGSVTAWAVAAFTPFEDGQTLTATSLNTAMQNLYTAVADLEAKPSDVPPGTIVAYMGTVAPEGWLLCDGSSYSKLEKPELFGVLGFNHGGDGANTFYLPDLRGRFLRGVDGDAGVDPDAESRLAPQPELALIGNQGNRVGSIQEDATALPNNPFTMTTSLGGGTTSSGSGSSSAVYASNHSHSINGGGDAETRPTNVYVNWIIKE